MVSPGKSCPYCGTHLVAAATSCTACGRPLPGAPAAPRGGGAPAKTMFGYVAPKLPGQAPAPAAPAPAAPAPAPVAPGAPPPAYGAPAPGAPPAAVPPAYGAPAPGAPPAYGAPAPGVPPAYGAPAPGAPPPAAPPAAAPLAYGAPGPAGAPPNSGQFGGAAAAPQMPQMPQMPPQMGAPQGGQIQPQMPPQMGAAQGGQIQPQMPPQMGAAQGGQIQPQMPPQMGAAQGGQIQPQMPPQMGAAQGGQIQPQMPPQMGAAQGGQIQPQMPPQMGAAQGLPQGQVQGAGMMNEWASKAPTSAPGTLFGIPLSKLRDQQFEKMVLMVAGIAVLVGLFIPLSTRGSTIWVWSKGVPKFTFLIWPILAAVCYLGVAFSPKQLKDNIPPVVLKWIPFGVALLSIGIVGFGFFGTIAKMSRGGMPGSMLMYQWGFPVLCFGLLARLARPADQTARIIAAVGAGMVVPFFFEFMFDVAFKFGDKALFSGAIFYVHNLLMFVVLLLAVASIAFVVSPAKVPALKGVDAFAPLVTAVLLAWLPVQAILATLALMVHASAGLGAVLMGLHMLINIVAFFGVLMLTAPEAYDELMKLFNQHQAAAAAGMAAPGPYQQQPGQPYQQQPGQPYQQQPGQPGMAPQQPGQPGMVPQQPGMAPPVQPGQPQQPPPGGYPPPPQGGGGGGWPQQ